MSVVLLSWPGAGARRPACLQLVAVLHGEFHLFV